MTGASEAARRAALRLYQRLPTLGRRWVVRAVAPSYTVGAMCIVERADGALLLVRHVYRERWGVPGGLLERGESPERAARREALEDVNLVVDLVGEPAVVVDAAPQRVDIVYRAAPAPGADLSAIAPTSPEIVEARWFPRDSLPELQHETAGALVALARSAHTPQSPAIPGSPMSQVDPDR